VKHLTAEVQETLAKSDRKSGLAMLTGFSSMTPQKGLQTFETGPVLFAYSDPAQHIKYEVQVDNDDMNGDQDELQLSLHAFRDGQEQEQDFGLMSSRLTVSLKRQQNIWRLNNISVGVDLPIGSPEFFKKTFLSAGEKAASGTGLVTRAGGSADAKDPAPVVSMPPEQVVMLLAVTESSFARQHPENGFTCSLSDLAETAKALGIDRQVTAGTYNGYRFNLTGCEGKPAGSFQVTAEPVAAAPGAKSFCTDSTQNLRVSDDGRGASCLSFGKVQRQAMSDDVSSWGVDVSAGVPRK